MLIQTKDKQQILGLIRSVLVQVDLVHELTLEVNDLFQIILELEDENKITEILNNDHWPAAIDSSQIVKTDEDKSIRAEGIIYLFLNNVVKDIRFLDFGCGDGFVAKHAADQGAKVSVGYDLLWDEKWSSFPRMDNLKFLTDFSEVQAQGPYDSILFYDVLDHCADPVDVLVKAKSVLAEGGHVYARCHPWCSRHGGHIYRSLNKAYAHLFLKDAAVAKLSNNRHPVQKIIHPLHSYNTWFQAAGFRTVTTDIVKEEPEPFFAAPGRAEVIKAWWKTSWDSNLASGNVFPSFQMSQQFVDFSLVAA